MTKQSITEFIKDYMARNNITLRDVAAKMGTSYQNVWLILNDRTDVPKRGKAGRRDPNYLSVKRLLDALGLEIVVEKSIPKSPQEVLHIAEHENIGFSTLQKVMEAGGLHMTIREKKQ